MRKIWSQLLSAVRRRVGDGFPLRLSSDKNAPLFEIQYHPSDIRKGVRYLFFKREHVIWGGVALLLYVGFLAFAASVTPGVVADRIAAWRYRALVPKRAPLGDHLDTLVERLAELEQASDAARLEISKIHLAYGFASDTPAAQAGFPFSAQEGATAAEEVDPDARSIYEGAIRRGRELKARIQEQHAVLQIFLDEVQTFESAYRDQVRTTPSTCPLRGNDFVLTSPFGNRRSPFTKTLDFHNGIDLAAAIGTPIYAPADGTVVFAGRVSEKRNIAWWRTGNLVAVNHADRFITLYAHCDEIKVKRGQKIQQGDVLATVGNTGWSTSPHLHYEVRRINEDGRDEPKDPRIYILDHRWRDEEQVLIRARSAPDMREYEPLPRVIRR